MIRGCGRRNDSPTPTSSTRSTTSRSCRSRTSGHILHCARRPRRRSRQARRWGAGQHPLGAAATRSPMIELWRWRGGGRSVVHHQSSVVHRQSIDVFRSPEAFLEILARQQVLMDDPAGSGLTGGSLREEAAKGAALNLYEQDSLFVGIFETCPEEAACLRVSRDRPSDVLASGAHAAPRQDHGKRPAPRRPHPRVRPQARVGLEQYYSNLDGSPDPRRTISGSSREKSITVVGSVPQSPESITASRAYSRRSLISQPWVIGSS